MKIQTSTLKNSSGMTIDIINYGGIVTSIKTPDKTGNLGEVVLGFDAPETYIKGNPTYYGAIVGRVANRIGGAKFKIDETEFLLFKNDGENALHGGEKGFDKVFWEMEELIAGKKIKLTYVSADMEEGYPGNLKTEVMYSLNEHNEFGIEYTATTDKTTHVNLTHHAYFNLSEESGESILDHVLTIDADRFTESDAASIPTGRILNVEGVTDFRKNKIVGSEIESLHDGYNHNFIINDRNPGEVMATLWDPKSGRFLEMMTTTPGVQLYTGFYLNKPYGGLCLEAQHYPDSPNKEIFPSTLLKPGETYTQKTVYRFSVRE